MLLNCVQQESISTQVNSSTFTRGQQFCASILLAIVGDTAMPGGLCHAFLVCLSDTKNLLTLLSLIVNSSPFLALH